MDLLLVRILDAIISAVQLEFKGCQALTLRVLIAQRLLPHVRQLDGAFRTRVHEPIAGDGMELRRCYDFRQLFHIRRLDIHDVEALILYVQVPQVYPQVVRADECLAITID